MVFFAAFRRTFPRAVFLATLRRADFFLAVFRAAVFFFVDFLTVVFLRAVFFFVDFPAVVFLRGAFFLAVFTRAAFLVAAFFFGDFPRFLRGAFLRAAFLRVVFFRVLISTASHSAFMPPRQRQVAIRIPGPSSGLRELLQGHTHGAQANSRH